MAHALVTMAHDLAIWSYATATMAHTKPTRTIAHDLATIALA